MGRAYNLIVLPARAVSFLPAPILCGAYAVPVGERFGFAAEKGQPIEEMAHILGSPSARVRSLLATDVQTFI